MRAFFTPAEPGIKHPVCRFIARYHWLEDELEIDSARLPQVRCKQFESLMADIQPVSVSLIFASAYMNSPASMFGHTLLLLEPDAESKLLSYAVNYAAVTPDSFGPLFAFKGLFGYYEGYFSVLPYYAKIQEYSDIDHRDIWEYQLNLSREEIQRLSRHLYELDFIHSDYYFTDENCSYTLLFLLDAARPGLNLTDQFSSVYVIPRDTIEAVEKNGLITDRIFRPSRTSKIRHLADRMPSVNRRMAISIAKGQSSIENTALEILSPPEQISVLDLASQYLRYLYSRKDIEKPQFQKRYLAILRTRSQLTSSSSEDALSIEPPVPPEDGHRPGRLSLSGGFEEKEAFFEIKVRPTNHELIDDVRGYQEGSQIIFFEPALRYFPSENRVRLQSLNLIDIFSISPRDELFRPVSWKVKTGLTQMILADEEQHLIFELNAGAGLAFSNSFVGLCYILLESDINLGGALEDNYAIGLGASAGIIRRVNDFWKVILSVKDTSYFLGDTRNAFQAGLQQNFRLSSQTSIVAEVSSKHAYSTYINEAKLSFNFYF